MSWINKRLTKHIRNHSFLILQKKSSNTKKGEFFFYNVTNMFEVDFLSLDFLST
jgi:hypothetical protein